MATNGNQAANGNQSTDGLRPAVRMADNAYFRSVNVYSPAARAQRGGTIEGGLAVRVTSTIARRNDVALSTSMAYLIDAYGNQVQGWVLDANGNAIPAYEHAGDTHEFAINDLDDGDLYILTYPNYPKSEANPPITLTVQYEFGTNPDKPPLTAPLLPGDYHFRIFILGHPNAANMRYLGVYESMPIRVE